MLIGMSARLNGRPSGARLIDVGCADRLIIIAATVRLGGFALSGLGSIGTSPMFGIDIPSLLVWLHTRYENE